MEPNDSSLEPQKRRRSRSRKGPLFPTIWFSLIGINWIVLIELVLIFLRPHPLSTSDIVVGACGELMGAFYLWVAYAVYRRRKYIIDVAFACAGFGFLSFPLGTMFSMFLLSDLMIRRHDFTK